MNIEDPGEFETAAERAIAGRLARLRGMPIDTSRIERALMAQLGEPELWQGLAAVQRRATRRWIRPLRAVAAVVLVLGALATLLLTSSGGPAMASAQQMAQVHEDMVAGRTPVMQVDSIDAANRALAAQWPQSPGIPQVPADHVMACCMKSVQHKQVACVLLHDEGIPITLTVASAADMRSPTSPVVVRNGVPYHVQSIGTLNMVMTERGGRWVCVIARLPEGKLIEMIARLQF